MPAAAKIVKDKTKTRCANIVRFMTCLLCRRSFFSAHCSRIIDSGVSSGRTEGSVFLARELIRFAHMASAPLAGSVNAQPSAVVRDFAARHYHTCGAQQFGMDQTMFVEVLAEIVRQRNPAG